ncbi:MAG: NCS2 family permease [Elusimicrobiota bacterium]|jgi:AGZA family xanthine/uracil permease-like MFS transporter|nr:NCS2 family permease [Elusimicrobiota bacterium]
MKRFFKLEENKTTMGIEVLAGLTTFFAMAYIIFVNPSILSLTGMPWAGVFAATIIGSALGTLLVGLYANVPFAFAPGMGLNAFFTFTLCMQMGYTWQEALTIDIISGLIIVIITITKFRKTIVLSIPAFLKDSISCGIGLFIAYIGFKNAGFLNYLGNSVDGIINGASIVPTLANFADKHSLLGLIGLAIMAILMARKIKGAIFIGIIITTIIGIPLGVVDISKAKFFDISSAGAIKDVAFAAFSDSGFATLFSQPGRIIMTITAVLAVFLSATFDAIGTFIGTGKMSGIFDDSESADVNKKGFNTKFEKALFCDGIASATGSLIGTSTVTTYVESAAGIAVGGKTGLTSVIVAILFLVCLPFAGLFGIVPGQATAPALIIVGILMMQAILRINWTDIAQAIPAFLTITIMAFSYNISYGIAAGFIFYCLTKLFLGKIKEVHPILIAVSALFLINFVITALK